MLNIYIFTKNLKKIFTNQKKCSIIYYIYLNKGGEDI